MRDIDSLGFYFCKLKVQLVVFIIPLLYNMSIKNFKFFLEQKKRVRKVFYKTEKWGKRGD